MAEGSIYFNINHCQNLPMQLLPTRKCLIGDLSPQSAVTIPIIFDTFQAVS